ncbi:BglG family transcription antiterminator [Oceanobacillus neutriphilus]|uniref:Transcriptional antiterminator n=1 Tax=Oceanobacillus neutriphilus TaxID=531815 RepID=A0ABQ2NQH6_9BACI|nr:PRD domain-containing protein [Oceanobacillus neutriphilus]GGP07825.1 transcriptional antiterminator [Oceanobacillus neutriphilus]
MTNKIKKIHALISELLSTNDYITVEELSEAVNVSPRTIHNYLNSMEFSSIISKAEIERRPNLGVKLSLNKKRKLEVQAKLQNVSFAPISKYNYDDFAFIMIHLFMMKHYLALSYIKENLYISSSSLQNIVNDINDFSSKFSCEIIYFKNKGLKILGSENDIRSLFLFVITNYISFSSNGDQKGRLSQRTELIIDTFFNQKEKKDLLDLVEYYEKAMQSRVCENDFNLILLYLMIVIVRLKGGNISKENNINDMESSMEYQYAIMLKFHIENKFNIEVPSSELIYLAKILMSARKQMNVINENNENDVIDSFIQTISTGLNIDLTMDEELNKNLQTHLRPAINRMKQGIPFSNPLLNHIKNEYTEVYLFVLTTIEDIEKNENIYFDSNEIGYICLHIIAAINRPKNINSIKTTLICEEGLSIEIYLKNKIEASFKEIEIINIHRTDSFKDFELTKYDLIINSTHSKMNSPNEVSISSIFSEDDYIKIKHYITFNQTKKQYEKDDLFKYLTTVRKKYSSQQEFIYNNCNYLFQNGYVTESFIDTVVERLKKSSTYVARNIAVIHGSKEEVLEDIVMIVNLTESITWEGYNVKTIIFIVTKIDNSNLFVHLLRQIMRIASSDGLANKLHSCENNHDLFKLLEEVK